jgi:putative peptidoglycan lipid II flippase
MEIFSKFFGSYLPEGGIAWLDYAKIIMMMLVAFFGQAVGVASYPFLARLAAEKKWDEMNRMFNTLLRHLTTLVFPASILMMVLRQEIVRVLFERGKFHPEDTRMTALALIGLLAGAVAFAAQTVVNRGFYAMQNTLLPAVYGTLAVIASLPLYWIGLKTWGLMGVALAISVSAMLQVVVLFATWNRRSGNKESTQVYSTFAKTVVAAVPLGAVLWLTRSTLVQWIDPTSFFGSIWIIAITGAIFVVCMALGGWWFRVESIRYAGKRLMGRLRPASGPSQEPPEA